MALETPTRSVILLGKESVGFRAPCPFGSKMRMRSARFGGIELAWHRSWGCAASPLRSPSGFRLRRERAGSTKTDISAASIPGRKHFTLVATKVNFNIPENLPVLLREGAP